MTLNRPAAAALDDGRIASPGPRAHVVMLAEQAGEYFVRRELGIDAIDGVIIDRRAADGSFSGAVRGRQLHYGTATVGVVAGRLTCNGTAPAIRCSCSNRWLTAWLAA